MNLYSAVNFTELSKTTPTREIESPVLRRKIEYVFGHQLLERSMKRGSRKVMEYHAEEKSRVETHV
jgi:hypothetical protein